VTQNDEIAGRMMRMDMARARPAVTVLEPRSTDDEASALLDELDKLQTLMALQMHRGAVWVAAGDLIQRTRILIIERCKRSIPTPARPEVGEV